MTYFSNKLFSIIRSSVINIFKIRNFSKLFFAYVKIMIRCKHKYNLDYFLNTRISFNIHSTNLHQSNIIGRIYCQKIERPNSLFFFHIRNTNNSFIQLFHFEQTSPSPSAYPANHVEKISFAFTLRNM